MQNRENKKSESRSLKRYQGFFTLLEREYYRFARLSKQTIAPPVITTLLFIFIFGFSLGSRIREIEGFSYIFFILPGLAAMGVITNSYANTSTSLFMARMDRSIENILVSPISNFQIISAFVLGGVFRGMMIGMITFMISILVVGFSIHHYGYTFLILFLSSVIFSCLGIISALWSESWDQIATFTNFLITPFVYLGGVFYSIQMLSPFWHRISFLNPIFYMVDALRFATLGHGDVSFPISLAVVSTIALFSFGVTIRLFQKGYKLVG